ncbi:hypothetical protein GCM10020256_53360 [Streptomyces thermocoprophilus]
MADGSLVDLPDGWALHIPDDHLDLRDLEQAIKDPERLRHAHGLFHGDPLDGIPGPAAAAARTRLRSLRDQLALEARPAPPSTTPPQSPQSPQSAPSTPPPASPGSRRSPSSPTGACPTCRRRASPWSTPSTRCCPAAPSPRTGTRYGSVTTATR